MLSISASGTAQDVVLDPDATLVLVQSIAGTTIVNTAGTAIDSDGNWSIIVPEAGEKAFTVFAGTTLSILGGGEVRISSFS